MDKLELTDAKELTNQEKEVYRTLRTNLEFTGVENRVIAVTSCGPDEGKSTVSASRTTVKPFTVAGFFPRPKPNTRISPIARFLPGT